MISSLDKCVRRISKRHSERGATATEYGLLVAFIAMAIVIGVTAFGSALDDIYRGFATFVTSNF